MKVRCLFKDPDTMQDAVVDAVAADVKTIAGLSADEQQVIAAERTSEIQSQITRLWMEYGEYLEVEFDTDAKTATVIGRS